MAHPADPSPKGPVAFTHARLSPEEADRLASMFRPSWELDDAPFTGAGTLSATDMQALQGGGVRADLRSAAAANPFGTNGTHAAPAPHAHETESSVIIDGSLTPADVAPSAPQGPRPVPLAAKGTMMGIGVQLPAAPPTAPLPEAPLSRPPSRPSQRPLAPSFQIGPPTPRAQPVVAAPSIPDAPYPKKSQMGLWIGLGAAAVVLLGVGGWAVTSGGGDKPAPAATATATAKPTEDKLSSVPPPPPATATTTAATMTTAAPAPPPPPATTTVAAAPPPVPTAPVTALPAAPPQPTHVAVGANPPRPASFGAPAAPPQKAPHKGGPTIVRDVPF